MNYLEDYFINENTVWITGIYGPFGTLCSKIIEGDDLVLVKMAPLQVINNNLLRMGSSLDGARKSSKKLLGKIKMHPITINSGQGIWLFPTKAYGKWNCVWLSLRHIKGTRKKGNKKTIIQLNYNHTIELDMRESSFNLNLHHFSPVLVKLACCVRVKLTNNVT